MSTNDSLLYTFWFLCQVCPCMHEEVFVLQIHIAAGHSYRPGFYILPLISQLEMSSLISENSHSNNPQNCSVSLWEINSEIPFPLISAFYILYVHYNTSLFATNWNENCMFSSSFKESVTISVTVTQNAPFLGTVSVLHPYHIKSILACINKLSLNSLYLEDPVTYANMNKISLSFICKASLL